MSALSPQKVLSPRKLASARQRLALVPAIGGSGAARTPFVVFMVGLLVGGVVGLLAFNTEMQQRSFAVTKLQHKATRLAAHRQQLRMELQQLNDPQQLAAKATRLGMVVPANPAFVSLGSGKVIGDPLMTTMNDQMNIKTPAARRPSGLKRHPKVITVPAKPDRAAAGAGAGKKSAGHGAASTKSGRGTGKKSHTRTTAR